MSKRNSYTGAIATSTAQIIGGKGVLEGLFVSSVGSSGTMAIYDGVHDSANVIISDFTLVAGYTYLGSIECSTGCYVETGGSPIYTSLVLSAD